MKIRKLQVGGMLGYSVADIPRARQSRGQEPTQSDEEEKKDDQLLSKDIIKELMEKGLSNDVDAFLSQLNQIKRTSINPRQAEQVLIRQYQDINKIVNNKISLQEAVARADKNSGLNEVAITTTGQILVENIETGKIDQVSAAQLKDNREILRPLTNSELVHKRQTDPSLAFNTSIASVIGNGVGPDMITKYILELAQKVGSSKQTSEGYVNKKEQNIAEGFKALLEGGVDGIYKVTSKTEDSTSQVNQALNYVYSMLPQNMKNYLRATSAAQGIDPEKGSAQLIQSMFASTMKFDNEEKVSFESGQTKLLNGESEDGSGQGINLDQSALIVSGRGTPRPYSLNPGTDHMFTIEGEYYQTPYLKDGEALNRSTTLKNLIQNTTVGKAINPGSVYLGDKKISEAEFDRVVYNNEDGFMTTFLPYKLDGEGQKVVDLLVLEEISKAKKDIELKGGGQITGAEKYKIYKEHNIERYFNVFEVEQTAVNDKLLAPFLMFSGITSTESEYGIKNLDYKSKYLNVDNERLESTQASIFQTAVQQDSGGKTEGDITGWFNNIHWIGGGHVIAGTVYIPITDDKISVYSANKAARIPTMHGYADKIITNRETQKRKIPPQNTTTASLGQ